MTSERAALPDIDSTQFFNDVRLANPASTTPQGMITKDELRIFLNAVASKPAKSPMELAEFTCGWNTLITFEDMDHWAAAYKGGVADHKISLPKFVAYNVLSRK